MLAVQQQTHGGRAKQLDAFTRRGQRRRSRVVPCQIGLQRLKVAAAGCVGMDETNRRGLDGRWQTAREGIRIILRRSAAWWCKGAVGKATARGDGTRRRHEWHLPGRGC